MTKLPLIVRAVVKREQDAFVADMEVMIEQEGKYLDKLRTYIISRHEYFIKLFRHGIRTYTIKMRNAHQLEQDDFDEIEGRLNILIEVFIKGILKK